jgi:methyltransferase (TIGR00027 family)
MDTERASRTAVLVCQGRAAADGLIAKGRFADPLAMTLLRADERAVVESVRDGATPKALRERFGVETVRASSEAVVPRTVAVDDAVRARPVPQLVILGAGLDDRAWRMPELAGVDVFEVDHPASQDDKRSRIADRAPLAKSVRFVPVDFTRDTLDEALATVGHRAEDATTWIWEGVVPYLSDTEVAATVDALSGRSAAGSRLVVDYQVPAASAAVGRLASRAMAALARQRSLWAAEPRRSTWRPQAIRALLAGHGFAVQRDDSMLDVATEIASPVRLRRTLRTRRIAIADR